MTWKGKGREGTRKGRDIYTEMMELDRKKSGEGEEGQGCEETSLPSRRHATKDVETGR